MSEQNDDRRIQDDIPHVDGASTRIIVSIEPEAAAMLAALCARMPHDRRIGARRAEIIEQGIRMVYRRTFGETSPAA